MIFDTTLSEVAEELSAGIDISNSEIEGEISQAVEIIGGFIESTLSEIEGLSADIGEDITEIEGTLSIQKYYTGSTTPSNSLGSDGDLYLKL